MQERAKKARTSGGPPLGSHANVLPPPPEPPKPEGLSCDEGAIAFYGRAGMDSCDRAVEQWQQLTAWLAWHFGRGAEVVEAETLSVTDYTPAYTAGPAFGEAVRGLLPALAGARLLSLHLQTAAIPFGKLDGAVLQLPRLQSLTLLPGSPPEDARHTVHSHALLHGSLAHLTALTSLKLRTCTLLAALPRSLRALDLDHVPHLFVLLRHLSHLSSLALSRCELPAELPPGLERLQLSSCRMSGEAASYEVLASTPQLRHLSICGGVLQPSDLALLTRLELLRLEFCTLCAELEPALEPLCCLTRLVLVSCPLIMGGGISTGLQLPPLPALKNVVVEACQFTHLFACNLAALEVAEVADLKFLKSLIMRGVPQLEMLWLQKLPMLLDSAMHLDLPPNAEVDKYRIGDGYISSEEESEHSSDGEGREDEGDEYSDEDPEEDEPEGSDEEGREPSEGGSEGKEGEEDDCGSVAESTGLGGREEPVQRALDFL